MIDWGQLVSPVHVRKPNHTTSEEQCTKIWCWMVPLNTSVHRGGHQFIAVNPKLEVRRCTDIFFEEIYKP